MSITFDSSRFKTKPFEHQIEAVKSLLLNPYFANFSEMGTGKTKVVIDAACVLYENGIIDTVVVVCPAQVKSVWLGKELGEIVKHSWVPSQVNEFGARNTYPVFLKTHLNWIVASYEFIRQSVRLEELVKLLSGRSVMVVYDESIFIKNHKAAQTKASIKLREHCDRAVLLNGTPISNNPLDIYSQFACLDPRILGYRSFYHFRARHALMGGWMGKQVIGFTNMDEIDRKVKPFLLRRLKKDCLDLPPKLYTQIQCSLSHETWKIYKEMRRDMVVWLGEASSTAAHAAVKSVRLSQITSGFLGGIQVDQEADLFGDAPAVENVVTVEPPREIGEEKLKLVLDWVDERINEDPGFRGLFWCRFRAELDRLFRKLKERYPHVPVHKIQGGQSKISRDAAIAEFQEGDRKKPAFLVGQPQAGGFGLTLTTCHTVMYVSNDYNLLTRMQSEDRVHRPGQSHPVTYVDVLAVGPDGQKTVDQAVVQALRKKEDVATWTTEKWREILMEE